MKPPNEVKYPEGFHHTVGVISPLAKELAEDLHHEAKLERIHGIIQLALNYSYTRGYTDAVLVVDIAP